jgi:hypothetical protein
VNSIERSRDLGLKFKNFLKFRPRSEEHSIMFVCKNIYLTEVKDYMYNQVIPTRIPIQKKILNLLVYCGTIPRQTQPWQTLGFFCELIIFYRTSPTRE